MTLDDVVCRGWKVWIEKEGEMICWCIYCDEWTADAFAKEVFGVVTKATVTMYLTRFEGL